MERRIFLAAAIFGSMTSTAIAQRSDLIGRERIASINAMPLNDDPTIYAATGVKQLLEQAGPEGDLARSWLRFLQGISGREGLSVDDVVTPDVRCIELELAGMPGDINTLRAFRDSMNSSLSDNFTLLEEMVVDVFQQIVEVKIHGGGIHSGEILGVPATGRLLAYDVKTLNLFKEGKMALRWDRTNLVQKIQELATG